MAISLFCRKYTNCNDSATSTLLLLFQDRIRKQATPAESKAALGATTQNPCSQPQNTEIVAKSVKTIILESCF
jgi:hypothetical protein